MSYPDPSASIGTLMVDTTALPPPSSYGLYQQEGHDDNDADGMYDDGEGLESDADEPSLKSEVCFGNMSVVMGIYSIITRSCITMVN